METITVIISFKDAEGGNVNVRILGPNTDYNYYADARDHGQPRNFHVHPAVYSIRVSGLSGGNVDLKVGHNGQLLVDMTCPPQHIYMIKSFAVN